GKTALAVHVGHRIRHAFPDGQLYADLRGTHEPTDGREPPQTPSQALPPFLRALGAPPDRIPTGFDEQLTLFRSMLSGKNVLLMLDDVASADQVRPLIPGDAGCSVLITSQHRLGGLVASNSAQVIDVETLSRAESHALIVGMIGRSTALHRDLVPEVIELCGYLPLALRIAAANLQHLPASGFRRYIADLQESNRRAALTTAVGSEAAVPATVAMAYATVGASDRRMLRYLALFTGSDITAGAAGALADVASAQAHNSLRRLTAAGLMQEHRPGRYQLHDLVHRFALERLNVESGQPERRAAIDRLGSWYLAGVRGSAATLHGEFVRLVPGNGSPPADSFRFSDVSTAAAWLAAEHRNLVALVRYFAEHEPRPYAWHLADGLRGHFWTGWFWDEWEESTTAALWAARESGDQPGIAAMSRSLGNLYNTTGDYTLALSLHAKSLRIHEQLGRGEATAATLNNITLAHMSLGRFDEAHHTGERALVAARKVDSRRAESAALALLGSLHWMRDELPTAAELLASALDMANALDLHHISVYVLRSLGLVQLALGDVEDARDRFKLAVTLAERIGSVYDASVAHYGLALAHRELGDDRVAVETPEPRTDAIRANR
ncbi:MAG: tetratricopeptide repeat protein, partial [Actinomycetia bacterium]|nr:tetratricopeptide repeat protein [Actinomycetes bacterium]